MIKLTFLVVYRIKRYNCKLTG